MPISDEAAITRNVIQGKCFIGRVAHLSQSPPSRPSLPHRQHPLSVEATGPNHQSMGTPRHPVEAVYVRCAYKLLARLDSHDRDGRRVTVVVDHLDAVSLVRRTDVTGHIRGDQIP